MPRRPGRPCNQPGCPNLAVKSGRCAKHQRPAWEGRRGFEGYKGDWLKIRARVLNEEPTCRAAGCNKPSVTVDHIIPKAEGGTDARGNLRGLCAEHRKKKDAEDAARGRRRTRRE